MRKSLLLFCALLVALVGAFAATRVLVQPPALRTATAAGQFDAVRAMARLVAILGDQRPHPADSFGDDAVRARLIGQTRAIGLNPIVRDQFACNEIYKQRGVTCARVRNVIVALGPSSGKALLLNVHYDSNSTGPAAADDGAGVATLLEVASILRSEKLNRPVLFLFNEGEELGLVGARAFMADPLSAQVGSLINLEARGVTGPVTMFETSLPNGAPVHAFAHAVDRPFANSLATDFYRQLPNYTDVNSFSERGWLTLNFAMIGNETRYHSPGDDLGALDVRSVQHMGDQTLAVARQLAAGTPAESGSLLFMDLAGRLLIVVPQWLGFGLLGLLAVGFAAIAWTRGRIGRGLSVFAAGLILSAILAWLSVAIIGLIRPGAFWRAFPAFIHLMVDSCGLFAAVAALALIGRRLAIEQLRPVYWLGFLGVGLLVFFVAPGGVIYFLFPPLAAIVGMLVKQERVGGMLAALLLWLTLGEVLALLGDLMVSGPFFALAPLAYLIAMPWLIEAKAVLDDTSRWRALAASAALVLLGFGAAAAAPAYSADRQQRFTIQHATDTGGKRAYWSIVNDEAPLPRNYGYIADWRWSDLPNIDRKRWLAPAPPVAGTAPPKLEIVARISKGKARTVRYRLDPRNAESVTLIGPKDAGILSFGAAGFVRPIAADTKGEYYLSCVGRSCAGAVLELTTSSQKPIRLTLLGSRRGLPISATSLIEQRPRFARPQYSPDATLTISRVSL